MSNQVRMKRLRVCAGFAPMSASNSLVEEAGAVGPTSAATVGPRKAAGKNSGNKTGPVAWISACMSVLCNSRTFPGHEYRIKRSIVSAGTSHTGLRSSRAKRVRKYWIRSGISSVRSRMPAR